MKIIKLADSNNEIFDKICKWYYNFYGIRSNETFEEARIMFEHSVNENKLPQTFIALINGKVVGMYQISVFDDLKSRPDLYPWLINVYVDENYRGQNVFRNLMNTVNENAKIIGIKELYLYTKYEGLYEKFGWKYMEDVKTFNEDSPIERLYKLEIK